MPQAIPAALDTGGREPLVLVPGMLGDAALWDDVSLALLERAAPRVARIDLDDSVPGMAESVLAPAPGRFALAGHSLGAIVALEVVRRAPGRVTRLALLNAGARPASEAQVAAWNALARGAEQDFPALAVDFARANVPPGRRSDQSLVARVAAMAAAVGPRGLGRQLAAQRTRPDSRPALAAIAVPVLVIAGGEDGIAPPDLQAELAAGIPGAELITLDGVGHMAPLEDPVTVAGHLARWLAR